MKQRIIVLIVLCFAVIILAVVAFRVSDRHQETEQIFAMDTYMELTVYGKGTKEALMEAKNEIRELEDMLSAVQDGSLICEINEKKEGTFPEKIAPLWEKSYEIYQKTEGSLDLTVYPVVKAWGFTSKKYRVPSEKELSECVALLGMNQVIYDSATKKITLPEGCELDFGAVAKGYTGDVLAQKMKDRGIKSALLYLGGNIQLIGGKPDGSPYKVGIKNPNGDTAPIGVLSVKDVAVVTSGGYERCFEQDGVTYHHIIDPHTGYPADNELSSVTIVAKEGVVADGYSTALYVYGLERSIAYWKEHSEEFEAVFVDRAGTVYVTAGLKDVFDTKENLVVIER